MLYKDLTTEQQEHLHDIFERCRSFPDDATHIDSAPCIPEERLLEFSEGGVQHYLSSICLTWVETDGLNRADNYFEIPEDFCRITGKITPSSKEESVQPSFPDFDFKLSCGDSPEVRQWLKDNGCVWYLGGCPLSVQTDKGYLYVRNRMIAWDHKTDWMIDSRNLPVIQPTFTVTGFTVPESEKKRKETLDKIKEKEDTIKRLTDEINQLKQENQTND